MKRALFIGRFQPLHHGHIDAIKQILTKGYKSIIIGFGSSQEKNTRKNPFDLSEREDFMKEALLETFPKVKFEFLAIPDFANSKKWLGFILTNSPSFQAVFTANPYVEFCFKESDKKIEKLQINLQIKATDIRNHVAKKNQIWQNQVPQVLVRKLNTIDLQNRFKAIFKDVKKNSFKCSALIIEKYTDLKYLEKGNFIEYNNLKSKKELEKNHYQHQKVKQYVLELLQELDIKYVVLKEDKLTPIVYSKHKLIITLGGDGTFLHAAKMVKNQTMIGVNTNPDKSVGSLTNFNIDTINRALNQLSENTLKTESWERLSVKINNKIIPHLALNEVFVGVAEIYKSSILKVICEEKESFFSGNGLIVSTLKGSTGFYKSANGTHLVAGQFGYATLLPFLTTGNLQNSQAIKTSQVITIWPERLNHVLVFDGDKNREVKLNQGDKVEIFINFKKCLKVAV